MSTVFYPEITFFSAKRQIRALFEIPFGILDPHQCQTLGSCRGSRHFTVFCRKDFFYFLRRIIALSHLEKCSGDDPHHIIEKTVSRDPEADQVVLFFHTRLIDRADGVGHLRFCRCKAFKIMRADQIRSRLPHRIHIERAIPEVLIQPPRRVCKRAV